MYYTKSCYNRSMDDLKSRFEKISQSFDRDKMQGEIRALEAQMMQPGFWDDRQRAEVVSRQLSDKNKTLETLESLEQNLDEKLLKEFELKTFLSGPHDSSEAILSIHSGTGGVEAMDWAGMLYRMYQRFFERKNWKFELTDESLGEEAGYKSVSMIVHAPLSYGYLKGEAGTHRLVRQSPFNADKLRQTSFALVEILPELGDTDLLGIEIKEEDLEWGFFRSSSKGGQNVQKVSTAVRLVHKPTGIVVTAQNERFQAQNRKIALDLLRGKLWLLKKTEEENTRKGIKGEYRPASWGTQIRSYVLHPYKMVKDLRTNVETGNPDAVLDGEIDEFIESGLRID